MVGLGVGRTSVAVGCADNTLDCTGVEVDAKGVRGALAAPGVAVACGALPHAASMSTLAPRNMLNASLCTRLPHLTLAGSLRPSQPRSAALHDTLTAAVERSAHDFQYRDIRRRK
jgi:hypothetical protein